MFKSRFFGGVLCVAATLSSAQPLAAEARTYAGAESQALQCAAYLSYTPMVLERRGLFGARDSQEGAIAATTILGQHVGGNFEQKRRAFEIVLSRLPESETILIQDTIRYASWCSEQFLQ